LYKKFSFFISVAIFFEFLLDQEYMSLGAEKHVPFGYKKFITFGWKIRTPILIPTPGLLQTETRIDLFFHLISKNSSVSC
jgi:hypothetical protein